MSASLARSCMSRLVVLAALLVSARAAMALNVGGPVCVDTTWHAADNPIVVTSSVLVGGSLCPAGAQVTLTIGPGVEVRFMPNRYLDVSTALVARGTPAAPILFTAQVKLPTPGRWNGIRFESTAQGAMFDPATGDYVEGSILEYCIVELAQDQGSTLGVIAASSAAPFLHEVTVRQSTFQAAAIGITGEVGPRIHAAHVLSNTGGSYGIYLNTPSAEITDAEVSGNTTSYAVYIQRGMTTVTNAHVTDNSSIGIGVGSGLSTINGSTVTSNAGVGLSVGGRPSIVGSTVSKNGGGGISAYSGEGTFLLQDCRVEANSSYGVYLSNYTGATITGNVIAKNLGPGLRIIFSYYTTPGVVVADNVILSNRGGPGLVVDPYYCCGTLTVSGNCISDNTGGSSPGHALDLAQVSATLHQNTVVNNASDAIVIEPSAVADIQQNNLVQVDPFTLRNDRPNGTSNVVATNNWWNTTDTVTILDKIRDCLDDGAFGCVQILPFATGPVAGAPDIDACASGLSGATTTTTSTSTTSTTKSTTTTRSTTTTTTTSSTTSTRTTTTSSTTSSSSSSSTTSSSTSTTTSSSSTSSSNTNPTTSSTSSTSTSSLPVPTTSSSSSTSSSSTTSSSSSASSTSSTSSTTSTTVPHCGNGVREPELGEQCDPAEPRDGVCCSRACRVTSIGGQCDVVPLDDCEEAHVCNQEGRCVSKLRPEGYLCREPAPNDICDDGDVCDGQHPDCLDTGAGQCSAELPPVVEGGRPISVTCSTLNKIASGPRPLCAAAGFMGGTGLQSLQRDAHAAADSEPACNGRRVTTKVQGATLRPSSDPDLLQRTVKLKLNPLAVRLLRHQTSLEVCVKVQISLGRTKFDPIYKRLVVKR